MAYDDNQFDSAYENYFIEHNRQVWGRSQAANKNMVLIPYSNYNSQMLIILSYCANYLAEQYYASIVAVAGITPWSTLEVMENKRLRNIYNSFGTDEVISDMTLSALQEKKVECLLEEIWPHLLTEEDWLNIQVNGDNYGKQILRDYYRYEMPSFDMHTPDMKGYLKSMLRRIVFWNDYFDYRDNVKAILVEDGFYREGIMTEIAIRKGVRVYCCISGFLAYKVRLNMTLDDAFSQYKKFFYELTPKEQKEGINWAKMRLGERLAGSVTDLARVYTPYANMKSVYHSTQEKKVLDKNDKIKVMICPHFFQDDQYGNGWQIFNSVWDWLIFLGELSKRTDYDWYLKEHPLSDARDKKIMSLFLSKYNNIKRISPFISPLQLKDEGIRFALTVYGSIGHEYPLIGIQVINAGNNRHISFDFDWNPKTRIEYEKLLMSLDKLEKDINLEEVYQFYCMHYLYYQSFFKNYLPWFFENETLRDWESIKRITPNQKIYKMFLTEWNLKRHKIILDNVKLLFENMENYRKDVFYRKREL